MDDCGKMRGDYYQYSVITTKPVLATRNEEAELAFNALPDTTAAKTGIPVNFFAAYEGDYTFSLNGKYGLDEVKDAQLWDAEKQQYYDLRAGDYSFHAPQGDNTSRFTLFVTVERKKTPTVATDFGEVPVEGQLSLVVMDKTLLLSGLKEDANIFVYDVSGKLLCSDYVTASGAVWRTSVPATGVYFVRVNSAKSQQTLRTIVK